MKQYPNIFDLFNFYHQILHGPNHQEYKPGQWCPARPLGYPSFKNRLKAAWLAFTGKADIIIWPESTNQGEGVGMERLDKTWYQKKMDKWKDDPEFLNEYIDCLKEENNCLEARIKELEGALNKIAEHNMNCAFMAQEIKTTACVEMRQIAKQALQEIEKESTMRQEQLPSSQEEQTSNIKTIRGNLYIF